MQQGKRIDKQTQALLHALFAEKDRLDKEVKQLTLPSLREKFDLSEQAISRERQRYRALMRDQ